MDHDSQNNELEAARERLDAAFARLHEASGFAATKIAASAHANHMASELETALEEKQARVETLEAENLRLHEQIARLSLQDMSGQTDDDTEAFTALQQEKNALQQNYDLLKRQYTALQDEMEGMTDAAPAPLDTDDATREITILRATVESLTNERNATRRELDQAIADLEAYLGAAHKMVGSN